MRNPLIAAILLLLVVAGIGCSGGSAGPVSPDLSLSGKEGDAIAGNMHLWGIWDVAIDPNTSTAEIAPVRGAEFTCDVNQFLQPPAAAKHLMGIQIDPSTDFATGYVVVDVSLTHPFAGLDAYTGFDVRGVCMGNGSMTGIKDPDIVYAGSEELRVLNADGLTRWFNPVEFTTYGTLFGFTLGKLGTPSTSWNATLNGYKYFCEGLDIEQELGVFFSLPACPNPRGYFPAGATLTRRYELQFPLVGGTPSYRFQYAVVANWEPPMVSPPTNVPDDFTVSANCNEAYAITTTDQSDMFYVNPSTKGGTLKLMVRVFDHQGAATPAGVASEIQAINLETSEGLISGDLATFDKTALDSAIVAQDEKSVTYRLEVDNPVPPGGGDYSVMVGIEDVWPSGYDPGYPGFAFPADVPLTAYFTAMVHIGGEVPYKNPVAVAEIVSPPPYCPGVGVEFDASGSYDQDEGGSSIVSYAWDFNGDDVYGDPFDSGTPANPTKIFATFGVYNVDVKVTDDEGATDTLDTPLPVSVGSPTWVDDDNISGPWDGSFDHPWPTIQQGINNANADCGKKWVLVKDGTYEENVTMIADITVEGYSTPAPTITTADGSASPMVNFPSGSNSILRHFKAKPRCTGNAITIGGSNNTVDDIEFIDNPGGNTCAYAVAASGANSVVNNVRCNGYHKSASGFITVSGSGSQVTDCVILNLTFTAASAMYALATSNIGATGLVAKNVVGHITFSEAFVSTQWVTAVDMDYCAGATIRNNLIFDIKNNLGDVGWTWGLNTYNPIGTTLEHNTIVGISGPAWIYGFETTAYNQTPSMAAHRDHIITDFTAGTMSSWRWAFLGYWGSTAYVDYSCTYNVGNSFYDSMAQGTGCLINVNPVFVNAAGNDYRVSPGSPCHNAAHDGTDMGAYGGSDPLTWHP